MTIACGECRNGHSSASLRDDTSSWYPSFNAKGGVLLFTASSATLILPVVYCWAVTPLVDGKFLIVLVAVCVGVLKGYVLTFLGPQSRFGDTLLGI